MIYMVRKEVFNIAFRLMTGIDGYISFLSFRFQSRLGCEREVLQ